MTFRKRQNTGDSKKIGGCQGEREGKGGIISGAEKIFKAVKMVCLILEWWIPVIIHFSEPKSESYGKLWTLSENDVSINAGSSIVTNISLWWGMQKIGEAVHVWGWGIYGKSLSSAQFHCQPKTALKNKVY